MQDFTLTARNEDFSKIIGILQAQEGRKLDVIASAGKIRIDPVTSELVVSGTEAVVDPDGVTPADGRYTPTDVFWDGVSDKLNMPRAYLRRMAETRPDLLAANVNGWLHGGGEASLRTVMDNGCVPEGVYLPDPRNFLLRLFRGDGGQNCSNCARSGVGACDDFPDCPAGPGKGVARAMLSDTYRLTMDNLDVLTAALSGVKEAGTAINITTCNLTERRLHVRVEAPEVRALAPILLSGYRNPFADPSIKRAGGWSVDLARQAAKNEGKAYEPGSEPVVWSGFDITNSETGGGAYRLTPVIKVQVCNNGLVIEADALRQVHLGARMDEGLFQVGADTTRKELELIALRARDAVQTWLDVDYLNAVIARLEEKAGRYIGGQAGKVETITRGLQFSRTEQEGVLAHFMMGGVLTAGGVMNAVTSFAQTVEDADRAFDIERAGVPALEAAYKLVS